MIKDLRGTAIMRKLLAIVLAVILAAGFIACTSQPSNRDINGTNNEDEPIDNGSTTDDVIRDIQDVENSDSSETSDYGLNDNISETVDISITGAIHRVEYGDNVAYLFGTMHASHEDWFPLAEVVEDALRRSDIVALEIAEVGMNARTLQQAIKSVSLLPNGLTWRDYLPEDAYTAREIY